MAPKRKANLDNLQEKLMRQCDGLLDKCPSKEDELEATMNQGDLENDQLVDDTDPLEEQLFSGSSNAIPSLETSTSTSTPTISSFSTSTISSSSTPTSSSSRFFKS